MSNKGGAQVVGIHSLPTELLLEILGFICAESNGSKSRTTLIAVCSRWRQVLLAAPLIWRTIVIDAYYWKNEKAYKNFLRSLEVQLIRSGSQQLHVTLDIARPPPKPLPKLSLLRLKKLFRPNLKHLSNLLARLAPFPAWTYLYLKHCDSEMLDEMYLDRMGGFTNLETVVLRSVNDPLLPLINRTVTGSLKRFGLMQPVGGKGFHRALSRIIIQASRPCSPPSSSPGSLTCLQPPDLTDLSLFGVIPDPLFPHITTAILLSAVVVDMPATGAARSPSPRFLTLCFHDAPPQFISPPAELLDLDPPNTHLWVCTLMHLFSERPIGSKGIFVPATRPSFDGWVDYST
ncbi:hypothetical protein FRC17_006669 [Serendipita sp. 399]|nr:hypothetical protein FRC17_006669 [Serendipita sp. 399]